MKPRQSRPVETGRGTIVEQSTVRGPVVIGEHCQIRGAFIVPHTAIGDDTTVLGRALIARGSANGPKALRVFVSDDSQITL